MTDLVRTDLAEYAPASNLLFNEHIRDLIQSGKKIYHFAFGQSPFPVVETAVQALRNHAGENAYLPVAGRVGELASWGVIDLRNWRGTARVRILYNDEAVVAAWCGIL